MLSPSLAAAGDAARVDPPTAMAVPAAAMPPTFLSRLRRLHGSSISAGVAYISDMVSSSVVISTVTVWRRAFTALSRPYCGLRHDHGQSVGDVAQLEPLGVTQVVAVDLVR